MRRIAFLFAPLALGILGAAACGPSVSGGDDDGDDDGTGVDAGPDRKSVV